MCKKLYVGNLSHDIDDSALEQMFSDYGIVDSVKVMNHCDTGQSRAFRFVEMNKGDEANAAITALNCKNCGSSKIKVNKTDSSVWMSQRVGCGAPF
jgi:RNA recognition motif-containing protein